MDIQLAPEFGYVVLVFLASVFLLQYLAINVGMARKKHGVKYPTMYSEKDQLFNCVQRAHQNTLEAYPTFVILLLLSGVVYPVISAVSGMVWIISRIVYAKGYYTGDPSARNRGAFGYFGLLAMLGCTGSFALQLLGVL